MSRSASRPKPGFKVFHGVAELGLGARLARSRRRLVLATLGITGAFVAYAAGTAAFMRASSHSAVLNVFLISGAMLCVLVVAFVQALLAGDLAFPGRWRERVILGERPEIDEDADADAVIGHFHDHSFLFYTFVAGLLVVNYLIYGLVTGGFLSEYQAWGYQHTLLGSPQVEDQIRGIRNVVNPLNREAQEAEPVRSDLIRLASTASDEVRGWALWAIGELTVYEAAPALRDLVADESLSEAVRARAAESLGRLADAEGARLMADLLARSFGRDELAIGLLRGLGLARQRDSARQIEPLLAVEPVLVRAHAYWALGRIGNRDYRDVLVSVVEEGQVADQCLAAEGLKFLSNRDDLVQAHTWFATGELTACEAVVWEAPYHWSDEHQFRMDIIVGEPLAAKYLKIVFTAGGARERDFFADIALDADRPDEIRALARELTLRIDHRQ